MEEERNELHCPPGPRPAPWLVFLHGKGRKDQTFFNLCEPITGKSYRKSIPELGFRLFRQSPSNQGWLIILCNKDVVNNNNNGGNLKYPGSNLNKSNKWKFGDCFLWNSVSFETIQLPTMFHLIRKGAEYHVIDSVMSSPPNSPNGCPMVFFVFAGISGNEHVLVYCRPGVDKIWRMQELSMINDVVRGVFCFKGKLYVLCPDELMIEVEIHSLDDDDVHEPISIRSLKVAYQPLRALLGKYNPFREHFVDSCNELFRAVQIFHPGVAGEVYTIEVFRMDFSSMNWVKMKSLGDHVLFLGEHTTMYCSATEMGLTKGCVYFTLSDDMSLYKFDLEDDSISVSLPCPDIPIPYNSSDWLMIPTVIRYADERRRMEDKLGTDEDKEGEETESSTNVDEKWEEESEKKSKSELGKKGSLDKLNDSLVELVATYLHPVDHVPAVSTANQLEVPTLNSITASTDIIHKSVSPWLVFSGNDNPIYNFMDPVNNEKYLMNLSEDLVHARIRFSKDGWLLMSSGKKRVFFFNPFTKARIQLPDLPGRYGYMFYGISFSSSPTSSDCVVFAITEWGGCAVFICYIARGDTCWSYRTVTLVPKLLRDIGTPNGRLKKFIPWFNPPVFYNGGFYCLDYCGTLGLLDLEDNFSWKVLAKPYQPCSSVYQCFLVECEGKLLSVFLGHLGSKVSVFKLDFSKMVWVKVKTLGKHMLFISRTSCLSAIASNSSMENKIFFPRFHGEGILFYSLVPDNKCRSTSKLVIFWMKKTQTICMGGCTISSRTIVHCFLFFPFLVFFIFMR